MAELMYKIANEEAPDIRIVRPELPSALADVVALALTKRPETRYQDGDQFAADLRKVIPLLGNAPAGTARAALSSDTPSAMEPTVAFSAKDTQPVADFEKTAVQPATPPTAARPSGATDLDI